MATNSTRERERAERQALLRLAAQLESEAERLVPGGASASAGCGWRRVAARQKRAAERSKLTKRALLGRVERNAAWIGRLWALLKETRGVSRAPAGSLVGREDRRALERLKMDAQIAGWGAVAAFAKHGVHVGKGGVECEDRWEMEVDASERRLLCVRELPFDAVATAEAVWKALTSVDMDALVQHEGGEEGEMSGSWSVKEVERSMDAFALKCQMDIGGGDDTLGPIRFLGAAQKLAGGESVGSKVFVMRSVASIDVVNGDGSGQRFEFEDIIWVATMTSASALSSTVAIVAKGSEPAIGSPSLVESDKLALARKSMARTMETCISEALLNAENQLLDVSFPLHSRNILDATEETATV